jgi:tetratricopeptide (TPR) repeat protein
MGQSGIVPGSYVAAVLRALGDLAADRGDLEQAAAKLDESLSLGRQVGDLWSAGRTLSSLASLAIRRHQPDEARALLQEAVDIQTRIEDRLGLEESRELMAQTAADGRRDRGVAR